mmetsp:Transcript_22762/g.51951  ORF Transcript_22762/g.51951 Transcript_22762/m.51951 type:complete len:346 (-) Transcript_22762:2245-3282(-)
MKRLLPMPPISKRSVSNFACSPLMPKPSNFLMNFSLGMRSAPPDNCKKKASLVMPAFCNSCLRPTDACKYRASTISPQAFCTAFILASLSVDAACTLTCILASSLLASSIGPLLESCACGSFILALASATAAMSSADSFSHSSAKLSGVSKVSNKPFAAGLAASSSCFLRLSTFSKDSRTRVMRVSAAFFSLTSMCALISCWTFLSTMAFADVSFCFSSLQLFSTVTTRGLSSTIFFFESATAPSAATLPISAIFAEMNTVTFLAVSTVAAIVASTSFMKSPSGEPSSKNLVPEFPVTVTQPVSPDAVLHSIRVIPDVSSVFFSPTASTMSSTSNLATVLLAATS